MLSKKIIPLLLVCACLSTAAKANEDWKYTYQFNFGMNVNFYFRLLEEGFPGIKVFAGASVRAEKNNISLNYAPSIAFYRKMIGNHFNPLVDDNQVDFTNSFTLGIIKDNNAGYEKHFRTMGNSQFYNISMNNDYGGFLGTTFIFNNHRRNQSFGSIAVNYENVTFYYGNDGGPPIQWLCTADMFDRWWTGSGCIFFHNKSKGYNDVEVSFDQFTGYSPLLYELSDLLGFNVPDYNGTTGDPNKENPWQRSSFNTSSYDIKIFPDRNYALHAGVIGSLKSKNRYWGVQDMIHIGLGHALHPNYDYNRYYLGGTYNYIGN